jgi:hypothetical protein
MIPRAMPSPAFCDLHHDHNLTPVAVTRRMKWCNPFVSGPQQEKESPGGEPTQSRTAVFSFEEEVAVASDIAHGAAACP